MNAVWVWGIARALEGVVLLRIEDHDRLRSRPEYEQALLEDLAWLGFHPDAGPVRQSDEPGAYDDALRRLEGSHHVYACDCSRKTVATGGGLDGAPSNEVPYSGRCRARGLALAPGRGLRVEIDPGGEHFHDARLGPLAQIPAAQCGDLLLRDRDGFWTYQFAVTVDDFRQGIDLVIRGEDLLSSTGRQLRLARMLGRAHAPVFLHHPLVRKPGGEKLSKSNRDTGVRELRKAGLSPSELIDLALRLCR